jgi:hypothetical protein
MLLLIRSQLRACQTSSAYALLLTLQNLAAINHSMPSTQGTNFVYHKCSFDPAPSCLAWLAQGAVMSVDHSQHRAQAAQLAKQGFNFTTIAVLVGCDRKYARAWSQLSSSRIANCQMPERGRPTILDVDDRRFIKRRATQCDDTPQQILKAFNCRAASSGKSQVSLSTIRRCLKGGKHPCRRTAVFTHDISGTKNGR